MTSFPISDCQFPIAPRRLPFAYWRLPIADRVADLLQGDHLCSNRQLEIGNRQ